MSKTFFGTIGGLWANFLAIVGQASGRVSDRPTQARRIAKPGLNNLSGSSQTIVRKHRPDYYIVMYMILLMLIGLVLIYAIGPQRVNLLNRSFDSNNQYSQTYFFSKQLISLVLAIVAFVMTASVPLEQLKKHALLILAIGLGTGMFLFIFSKQPLYKLGLVQCSLGACRWLNFRFMTIQVAEVIKISLVVFFAVFWKFFADKQTLNKSANLFYSAVILALALLMIVVWQNDLGTGLSMVFILLAMLWNAGVKPQIMLLIAVCGAVVALGFVAVKPHRMARVMTFLKGDSTEITDSTRHIIQAKIAVGSGGMFGLGIGKSVQATGYLPEAINDSIFAIIGEVFGFAGCIVVVGLFAALVARLLKNVATSHDTFNRLLITGAAAWVFSHFAINITSMLGIAPMTGITLPFLSYGGTSMIFVAGVLGLAFNASQFTAHSIYSFKRGKL